MSDTAATESVVTRYFAAWTTRQTDTVRALLADDYAFSGPGVRIDGRDAFLSAGGFPTDASTELVAQAAQGSAAFQMYDCTRLDRSVRIVEHLQVADGKIIASTIVTDPAAFGAFMGAP